MTHLRIELNNIQENVSSAVIKKLYELATSGDLDLNSNLAGNLHTTATYLEYIDGIRTEFPDLTISTDNVYIWFLDSAVRDVLKNSIGDGVGITLALAANADIHNTFKGNTSITSFNEFNKFTNSLIDVDFDGCTNLSNINLSEVTGTSLWGFRNCRSLTNTSISSLSHKLTHFGDMTFYGCSNLSGIIDLSNTNVTKIPYGLFEQCSSITGLIIPTTVTLFGDDSHSSPVPDSSIILLKGFDNVTYLPEAVRGNVNNAIYCGKLESGQVPVICSMNGNWFNTSILLLYMPKYKSSGFTLFWGNWGLVGKSVFCYSGRYDTFDTIKLLYFRDLLSIAWFDFYASRIKNLVINNTTPPTFNTTPTLSFNGDPQNRSTWESNMFGTIPTSGLNAMTIYVPDSAVATYQADSNYNAYTIRGINEVDPNTNQPYLTRYATNDLWEAAGKPEDALIEEYMN